MRVVTFILNVLITAALVTNAPAFGGALPGIAAQLDDGHSAATDDMAPHKTPCPAGHCRDGQLGEPDCPAGLGACGGALYLAVPAVTLEPATASRRVALAGTARLTVGPHRHDPPPPRIVGIDV